MQPEDNYTEDSKILFISPSQEDYAKISGDLIEENGTFLCSSCPSCKCGYPFEIE